MGERKEENGEHLFFFLYSEQRDRDETERRGGVIKQNRDKTERQGKRERKTERDKESER